MTLTDLCRAVELLPAGAAVTLTRDELLAALRSASAPPIPTPASEEPETWLTAEECARLLNVSKRWCYDHADELGGKRLSRRCTRFSSRAVARYLGRHSRR
jgi:hypothetical protein